MLVSCTWSARGGAPGAGRLRRPTGSPLGLPAFDGSIQCGRCTHSRISRSAQSFPEERTAQWAVSRERALASGYKLRGYRSRVLRRRPRLGRLRLIRTRRTPAGTPVAKSTHSLGDRNPALGCVGRSCVSRGMVCGRWEVGLAGRRESLGSGSGSVVSGGLSMRRGENCARRLGGVGLVGGREPLGFVSGGGSVVLWGLSMRREENCARRLGGMGPSGRRERWSCGADANRT